MWGPAPQVNSTTSPKKHILYINIYMCLTNTNLILEALLDWFIREKKNINLEQVKARNFTHGNYNQFKIISENS